MRLLKLNTAISVSKRCEMLTDKQKKALNLFVSVKKASDLTQNGHALINNEIKGLLALGLVDYAPSKSMAYKVTNLGKSALISA